MGATMELERAPEVRRASGRRCARGCGRAVGPRNKHCRMCGPFIAATRFPCPEAGCSNTMNHKQRRCSTCKRRLAHDVAVTRWQRVKEARALAATS